MSERSVAGPRLFRLTFHEDTAQAHPLDAPPTFAPLPVPAFPLSQSHWLLRLAHLFHLRHQRGLATLLILDLASRQWVMPFLPTQHCTAEGAAFRLLAEDLHSLPATYRVGGSFQSLPAATAQEAQGLVPGFDGLHLIHVPCLGPQIQHFFLRAGGEIHQVQPESAVFDDWQFFLQLFGERLRFS